MQLIYRIKNYTCRSFKRNQLKYLCPFRLGLFVLCSSTKTNADALMAFICNFKCTSKCIIGILHCTYFTANAAAAAMNNNAQTSNKSNNAAILSLLNSTPANLTPQKLQPRRISLNTSIPPRVISHGNVINVPNTTGQVRITVNKARLNLEI